MTGEDTGRTLVAGIGNIFLTDDGFGVEAVRAVEPGSLPPGVDVADYGIRGVHLAYELLAGRYDALVMIDAVPLGDAPGTLAVLDVSGYERREEFADWAGTQVDAHSMQPEAVLAALHNLGGAIGRVYVVGCQPAALRRGHRPDTTGCRRRPGGRGTRARARHGPGRANRRAGGRGLAAHPGITRQRRLPREMRDTRSRMVA